ncbi:MAG: PIN domain-containing protein [Candidatus Woesearchaeota archaeon]
MGPCKKDGNVSLDGRGPEEQRADYGRRNRTRQESKERNRQKSRPDQGLVVDANIVFAALIRDGPTRQLIAKLDVPLLAPETILAEIMKHHKHLLEKSNATELEFDKILKALFLKIDVAHFREYHNFIELAKLLTKDIGDVPFVALALARQADIWSEDKGFPKNEDFRVFKTKEILERINRTALNSDHKV